LHYSFGIKDGDLLLSELLASRVQADVKEKCGIEIEVTLGNSREQREDTWFRPSI
jgi:hypothetical protein